MSEQKYYKVYDTILGVIPMIMNQALHNKMIMGMARGMMDQRGGDCCVITNENNSILATACETVCVIGSDTYDISCCEIAAYKLIEVMGSPKRIYLTEFPEIADVITILFCKIYEVYFLKADHTKLRTQSKIAKFFKEKRILLQHIPLSD